MPPCHDVTELELAVNDDVIIHGKVIQITHPGDYCAVKVEYQYNGGTVQKTFRSEELVKGTVDEENHTITGVIGGGT